MILDILIFVFIGVGLFFNLLAGVGLLRFPDVYTRLHAGTKCTTFGSIFLIGSVVLIGLNMWWEHDTNGSVLTIHSMVALIAILLTNPVGAHAIARAAHRSGVRPVGAVVDELAEKPAKTPSDPKRGGT
jgi:multicomponent Na+:H+ antiporter subunit G